MGKGGAISTDRILGLLRSRRSEHACAAALVLGALRPADPRVSRALARKLRSAEAPIRPYLRDALASQRTDEALAMLAEGMLGTGVEREQSRLLSVECGSRMLPHFERVLAEHPDEAGAVFFRIAANFRTRASAEWMLGCLADASAPRALALYRALRSALRGAYPRSLRRLVRARVSEIERGGPTPGATVARRLLRCFG